MSAGALPSRLPSIARRTIVKVWPTDPKNISFRRPIFSIRTMAAKEARKYSVPLHAAMIRDLTSENPRRSKRTVLIYDQTLGIRRKKYWIVQHSRWWGWYQISSSSCHIARSWRPTRALPAGSIGWPHRVLPVWSFGPARQRTAPWGMSSSRLFLFLRHPTRHPLPIQQLLW